jgi:cytoskeletal protein RodZ
VLKIIQINNNFMSKNAKLVIGIVIVIIIIVIIWIASSNSSPTQVPTTTTDQSQTQTTVSQVVPSPTDGTGMSVSADTSDAALGQDTQALDAQISGLATDSANVDQSVNSPAADLSL